MPRKTTLDVTVVLLEAGYASTAIAPIEVFHSAGLLWNWLHGETPRPRLIVSEVGDAERLKSGWLLDAAIVNEPIAVLQLKLKRTLFLE